MIDRYSLWQLQLLLRRVEHVSMADGKGTCIQHVPMVCPVCFSEEGGPHEDECLMHEMIYLLEDAMEKQR